jgi:hypothetical protein
MLGKIFYKNQDKKQLVIAMIGSVLGITFLIASIHYLIKVDQFGKGADILGPNTIIVQKKVSNSSSLNLSKTDFSPRELEKIKAESFIQDVKPVISNNFDVSFQTNDPLVPYFRSDVFIQTIDESFLDVKLKRWDWVKEDKFVPIILPRDFLVMLNTFMSASGIPQVSDDLAKDIKFQFRLTDAEGRKEYINAQIVGFTNEVASILVPASFMDYGNQNYSQGDEAKITQIMISGKESEFGLVEDLLIKKGLESKNSQMVVGRLKSVVGTLFFVVLCISVVAVFLSGLVLIQYLQLLLSRNAYQVRTMLRMGYPPKQLIRSFTVYFVKIFGAVSVMGFLIFLILKFFIDEMFASGGLHIDTKISSISILAVILAYLLFSLASYLNAKKGLFKEY